MRSSTAKESTGTGCRPHLPLVSAGKEAITNSPLPPPSSSSSSPSPLLGNIIRSASSSPSSSSSPILPSSSASSRDSSPSKHRRNGGGTDLASEPAGEEWPPIDGGTAMYRRQRWRKKRPQPHQPICAQSSCSSLLSLISSSSSGIGGSSTGSCGGTETPPPAARSPTGTEEEGAIDGGGGPAQRRQTTGTAAASKLPRLLFAGNQAVSVDSPPPPSTPPTIAAPLHHHQQFPPPPLLLLDLSNPSLHHFYVQQRLFYRQIYAQQLAALTARLGLMPPPGADARRRAARRRAPFCPSEEPPPHQHLGFPPAPPASGPLLNWVFAPNSNGNGNGIGVPPPTVVPQNGGGAGMYDGGNGAAGGGQGAPTTDEHMMALRIRHVSNASTKSNERSTLPLDQNQSKPPFTSGGISCMDVLSERIYNFHQNIEQSHYQMNRKLMLRDQLYYAISPIFPLCGLYIVGSSLNGFGTSRSDLDLCLMITSRDIDQRSDAIVILTAVTEALKHNKIVVDQQLIAAKVPILRIKCSGVYADIMVDLNVNNSVAIRNTHLLCYYSAFDWRVRPIVMVVKEWAKRRGINNASRSTFTSYSLVLMVIHYLQCGASPPVLPSLQQLYSQRFSDKLDVRQLNVSQPLDPQPSDLWSFDQRLSLSELLLGFLKYYAFDFNFDRDAISIRLGRKLERSQVTQNQSPFNSLSQWHCICIEEPFTLSNAAHSVYDERIFQEIKKTFAECYTELDENRDLDGFLGKTIAEENENGPEIAQPAMNGNDNNNMRDELA